MNTFTKTIAELRIHYDRDQFDLSKHFWDTIDCLDNQQVFYWVERMLHIRHLLQGKDYIRVVGIQHQYREIQKWTKKQKRSIVFDLIKNWYEIEFVCELA